jgi:hypothetical protein
MTKISLYMFSEDTYFFLFGEKVLYAAQEAGLLTHDSPESSSASGVLRL